MKSEFQKNCKLAATACRNIADSLPFVGPFAVCWKGYYNNAAASLERAAEMMDWVESSSQPKPA